MASTSVLWKVMVLFVFAWSSSVVQSQESSSSSMDESITPTVSSTTQAMETTASAGGGSGQSPTATTTSYATPTLDTTASADAATTATAAHATTATVSVTPSSVSPSMPVSSIALSSLLQLYGPWLTEECNKTCCGSSGVTLNQKYVQKRVCNAGKALCDAYAHLEIQNVTCPTCKDGRCVFSGESGAVGQSPFIVLIFSAMLLILGYLTV